MLILLTASTQFIFFLVAFNTFPELSRTSGLFPGLSSPGKCHNKIPGLSRFSKARTNPVTKNSRIHDPVFFQHFQGPEFQFPNSRAIKVCASPVWHLEIYTELFNSCELFKHNFFSSDSKKETGHWLVLYQPNEIPMLELGATL